METYTRYTESEIDLLLKIIKPSDHILPWKYHELIHDILKGKNIQEQILYRSYINKSIYSNVELYGEARFLVVFAELNNGINLTMEFWTRHLRRFLFKGALCEMPLLINVPYLKDLASWRLQIAK